MAQETAPPRKHSNAYNIFILVLTVLSLAVMVVMLLPISDATLELLSVYDNLISVIFLIAFFQNLRSAPHKSDYFLRQRDAGCLYHQPIRWGAAGIGIGTGRIRRHARVFLGAVSQPAGLGRVHGGLRLAQRGFL